jgi:hypothetical protein
MIRPRQPYLAVCAAALFLAAAPAFASSGEPPSSSAEASETPAAEAAAAPPPESPADFPTAKQKLKTYVRLTAGPGRLAVSAFSAAWSQWLNHPEEWGQGWDAYGKRYAHRLAYNGVRQTISLGVSFAFREDNRYRRSTDKGLGARLRNALSGPLVARHPDGRATFSISSFFGYAGASAISSIWGPPSWKGARNIAADVGISLAGAAAYNLVLEFLPRKRR